MSYNSSIRQNGARSRAQSSLLFLLAVFTAAFCLLQGTSAFATPLAINTTIPSAGETDPAPGYTILADTGIVPFTAATFTGTLHSLVITNDSSNPYGAGAMTFLYQVANTAGPHSIEHLTVNLYSTFATDVSYQIPSANVAPAFFSRVPGDVMGFTFFTGIGPGSALGPGMTSTWLVVQTNATNFQPSTASVIDGSTADGIITFAPATAAPEPGTLVLAALGAMTAVLAFRKR